MAESWEEPRLWVFEKAVGYPRAEATKEQKRSLRPDSYLWDKTHQLETEALPLPSSERKTGEKTALVCLLREWDGRIRNREMYGLFALFVISSPKNLV